MTPSSLLQATHLQACHFSRVYPGFEKFHGDIQPALFPYLNLLLGYSACLIIYFLVYLGLNNSVQFTDHGGFVAFPQIRSFAYLKNCS